MNEKLVKIKLYGHLRKFGKEFEVYARSPKEAVHALCCQLPGFKAFLQHADKQGITFAIFNGKRNIGEEELELGAKSEVRIATVMGGRKKSGLFQTILGIILVVVGVFTYNPYLIQLGAALAIGGIIQMMTPQAGSLSKKEDADNSASYAFGGPVNTTAQGNPIGILYGRREIGGAIISAGIFAEDQQ